MYSSEEEAVIQESSDYRNSSSSSRSPLDCSSSIGDDEVSSSEDPVVLRNAKSRNSTKHMTRTKGKNKFKFLSHVNDALIPVVEENLNTFYVQQFSDKQKIEKFMEEVSVVVEVQPQVEDVEIGDVCFALYHLDNEWYRVVVLSEENHKYTVLFVDYGNKDVVSLSKLKVCPPHLNVGEVQPFAYPCCLWNMEPYSKKVWSEKALPMFLSLYKHSKQIGIYVYSVEKQTNKAYSNLMPKHYVDVQLCPLLSGVSDDHLVSLRKVLVYQKIGKFTNHEDLGANKIKFRSRFYYTPVINLNSAPLRVTVLSCTSPSKFSLQLESSSKALKALTWELTELYDSMSSADEAGWKIYCPAAGMLCAVKNEAKKSWRRAEILSLLPDMKVRVYYVDDGREDDVHWSLLRKITDKFLNNSMMAVSCKLAYVSPIDTDNGVWGDEAIELFQTLVLQDTKSVCASFTKSVAGVHEVSLLVMKNGVKRDVAKFMISADLAIPSTDIVNVVRGSGSQRPIVEPKSDPFLEPVRSAPNKRSIRNIKSPSDRSSKETVTLGNKNLTTKVKSMYLSVKVVGVTSPSLIHARFTSREKQYAEIQENLRKHCSTRLKADPDFSVAVGKVCAVNFYGESPYFARAKVLEKMDSSICKVHLIDCGGITDVDEKDLMALPPNLVHPVSLALALSLADVKPPCGKEEWPASSTEFLERLINENSEVYILKLTKCTKDPSLFKMKILPVEMGKIEEQVVGPFEPSTSEYISFRSLLLNEGLALPKKTGLIQTAALPEFLEPESSLTRTESVSSAASGDTLSIPQRKKVNWYDVPEKFEERETEEFEERGNRLQKTKVQELDPELESLETGDVEVEKEETYVIGKQGAAALDADGDSVERAESVQTPLAPQPPLERDFEGLVTNVKNKGVICILPLKNEKVLSQMKTVHGLKFNNSEVSDADLCWRSGDIVVAKYHLDEEWYRAKIIKRESAGSVLVDFIDYGNEESVPVEDIRTENDFAEVPKLCYMCSLAGVIPNGFGGWSERSLDILHTLIVMNNYKVQVVQDAEGKNLPKVHLKPFTEGELDVVNILVNKLRICSLDKTLPRSSSPDVIVLNESP